MQVEVPGDDVTAYRRCAGQYSLLRLRQMLQTDQALPHLANA